MRYLIASVIFISVMILLQEKIYSGNFYSGPLEQEDSVRYRIIQIKITGNKITRERIIRRELLFKEGDVIDTGDYKAIMDQSYNNLNNTSLFNFIEIDSGFLNSQDLTIVVNVIERWYIWPFPIFEIADRNFNAWWDKKDWSRINYGLYVTWNNFRGRREKLVLYTRFGFDEKYHFSYQVPYINRKQTLGMGFSAGLERNHEVAFNSVDNKEVYYKSTDEYPIKTYYTFGEIIHRKDIHSTHLFKLSFNRAFFSDSVLNLNPNLSFENKNLNEFLSFYYHLKGDFRDYKHYPLKGYYFDAVLDKTGLGFMLKEGNLILKTNARKYWKLRNRLYFASGFTGKISPLGEKPYYYEEGLGYGRDFVRGYEYYVVDGQHYGLLKNNLKFALIPRYVKNFDFIPTEKFSKIHLALYMNLFTDFAWVSDSKSDKINPLANQLLIGSGLGFDLVTYYDMVFRFELSINKKGETGFFLHFMAPI